MLSNMRILFVFVCIWSCALAALPPSSNDDQQDDTQTSLRRDGNNVCSYMETRPVKVRVSTIEQTLQQKVVRVKGGWWRRREKKIIYKMATRTVYHTITKMKQFDVYYCCSGWTSASNSDECSIPICSIPCMNGASCIGPDRCSCAPGYEGKYCQNDVNECESLGQNTCGQKCENVPGSFRCYCEDGYVLNSTDKTSCVDINECSIQSTCRCSKDDVGCNTSCINTQGSYKCICNEGYYIGPDGTCTDRNECIEDVCQHRCINTPGSYHCSCHLGFQLNITSGSCYDIDECKIDNGGCNHFCHNVFGGSVCSCKDGFYLDDDQKTCKAIRPSVKSSLICADGDEYELISCDWPKTIKILHAFYGRVSSSYCQSKNSTFIDTCSIAGAKEITSRLCQGTNQCYIDTAVVADRLHDSCPQISKYLRIFYQCTF